MNEMSPARDLHGSAEMFPKLDTNFTYFQTYVCLSLILGLHHRVFGFVGGLNMWTLLAAATVFMGGRTGRTQSEFQRRYSHLNPLLLHSRLVSTPGPHQNQPCQHRH